MPDLLARKELGQGIFKDGFLYGADYNPEQWDAATIDEDIQMMKEAGVNMVSLGIFSWAVMEPEEGKYDFSFFLQMLDKLHAAGIKVDMATATASPPAWLARRYPQTLPVTADGIVLGFGSRQQYVPCNNIVKEKMVALVTAIATAVKGHPAIKLWHVSNEYGCHVVESFDTESVAAFRQWLQEKYQNIEALNEAWCTNFWSQKYQDFSQVGAPAAMPTFGNAAQKIDWTRFNSEKVLDLFLAEAEVLRQIAPEIPVTTNFMGLFPRLNYWQWAKHMDIVSDDSYPDPADPAAAARVAFEGDLMRSLGGGRPFLLMEQTPSAVQWRPEGNSPKRPGQLALWSLARIAHGASGIMHFQWRQSWGGAESMHSGMVPHAGRRSPVWKEVTELGAGLSRLSAARDRAGRSLVDVIETGRVALVLDWENIWALENVIGPIPFDPFKALQQWHRTLWEAGYLVDFVSPDADFTKYKLVVVPQMLRLPSSLGVSLEEALAAGVQVVVAGPTGIYDENMKINLGGYLGPLRKLAGVSVVDLAPVTGPGFAPWTQAPVPEVDRITGAIKAPSADPELAVEFADASSKKFTSGRWVDILSVDDADVEVIASFCADGPTVDYPHYPAVTKRAYGDQGGCLWYLGTDLEAPGRAHLFTQVAESAQITPEHDWLPDGVEALRRGEWMFLLNHSDKQISLPQPVADIYSGTQVSMLAPRTAVVYLA